ncbi:MAG: NusG domain II-containing protein, partial [Lachnospiraceae bacterium]|nr:NusG domain II-containing protein [Lachnospiraceae bacterium]
DIILIAVLAAVLAICALFLAGRQMLALPGSKNGAKVEITRAGETSLYPLDQDTQFTLTTKEGGTNTNVIKEGEVRVTEADCPDMICVTKGSISRTGQTIVCMPHQLVIRIISNDQEIDGVAQ